MEYNKKKKNIHCFLSARNSPHGTNTHGLKNESMENNLPNKWNLKSSRSSYIHG
jgi:hypothetical protein